MKNWWWILILMGLLGAGWFYFKDRQLLVPGGVQAPRVTTAKVEARNIQFIINAAGEIGPADQVSVRPEINGRIAELPVDLGDSVKQGALLFRLDDQDLQIEIESRNTDIARARLQLEQAERNYTRSRELYEAKLISKELHEETKTQYDLAKNTLLQGEKALDLVKDRIRKTRIVAPFDCTVLTRPVSVGQAVSGSGGVGGGTEVLTIANLNDMIINAHINQADVAYLKLNEMVRISVEAVPGLEVQGKIERIAPQATIKNNIKGFATRILLSNVDKRVRPGMTANIRIPVASADNVLAVPLAAVFSELDPKTQQYERYVYVQQGSRFERRPVQVGVSDYFYAEIKSGLQSGETVALEQPATDSAKAPDMAARGGGPGRPR
ncbi:MAG TPA: efflux RND transporter periplasmic adaptor subunit [Verrucomicrobiota bacterium]|nr:efflux RND transporter periplasmic adaptor subunit [Verrucomicrobiota bacterium]HNT14204.1 efflux RND transporter periplasmic adaptor subunit [Verrucomicrobiota bacterium]